jgi:hypothetical protein
VCARASIGTPLGPDTPCADALLGCLLDCQPANLAATAACCLVLPCWLCRQGRLGAHAARRISLVWLHAGATAPTYTCHYPLFLSLVWLCMDAPRHTGADLLRSSSGLVGGATSSGGGMWGPQGTSTAARRARSGGEKRGGVGGIASNANVRSRSARARDAGPGPGVDGAGLQQLRGLSICVGNPLPPIRMRTSDLVIASRIARCVCVCACARLCVRLSTPYPAAGTYRKPHIINT